MENLRESYSLAGIEFEYLDMEENNIYDQERAIYTSERGGKPMLKLLKKEHFGDFIRIEEEHREETHIGVYEGPEPRLQDAVVEVRDTYRDDTGSPTKMYVPVEKPLDHPSLEEILNKN